MSQPNQDELKPSTLVVQSQLARGDPDAAPSPYDVDPEELGPRRTQRLPSPAYDEPPTMGDPTSITTEDED